MEAVVLVLPTAGFASKEGHLLSAFLGGAFCLLFVGFKGKTTDICLLKKTVGSRDQSLLEVE